MAKHDPRAEAKAALKHLTSAGVRAKLMDGGRCALGWMRLNPTPFDTLDGSVRIDQVIFSTVGRHQIKCLKPLPLFHLPLIRVHDCRDTTSIEARIRLAWKRHLTRLAEARAWLDGLGADTEVLDEGTRVALPIDGESRRAQVDILEPRRALLPSHGPLTGTRLRRPEDRCMRVGGEIASSVDLEIAVSTRVDELLRLDRRIGEQGRQTELVRDVSETRDASGRRPARVLLAGPRLSRETTCIESMRLRGFVVDTAFDERDALSVFDRCSPELVLADVQMDRSDGSNLVLALRQVAGIEELPVVLVDESHRDARKEAARRVGAAGYMTHPVDVGRISAQLERMVSEPHRRRYTRYARRLPLQVSGDGSPCMVTAIGRGGMFVATDAAWSENRLQPCRVSLPEIDASVSCEAEVLYRRGSVGRSRGGYGLQFRSFSGRDENRLIEYLQTIDRSTAAAV